MDVMAWPEPVAAAAIVIGELTVEPFAGEQIMAPAVVGALQPVGGGGALPTVNVRVVVCSVPVLSHAFTVSLCVPAAAAAEPESVLFVEEATAVLSM